MLKSKIDRPAIGSIQLSHGKIIFENCAVTYVSEDHVCVVGYQEMFSTKWVWCFYNLSPAEAGEIVSAAMDKWNLFTR